MNHHALTVEDLIHSESRAATCQIPYSSGQWKWGIFIPFLISLMSLLDILDGILYTLYNK